VRVASFSIIVPVRLSDYVACSWTYLYLRCVGLTYYYYNLRQAGYVFVFVPVSTITRI